MEVNASGVRDTVRVLKMSQYKVISTKKNKSGNTITVFYTDAWGAYSRHLPVENHVIGKLNTQRMERKNLTLRTLIKRFTRKTICFSKSAKMYDIVIGLTINFLEFSWIYFLFS